MTNRFETIFRSDERQKLAVTSNEVKVDTSIIGAAVLNAVPGAMAPEVLNFFKFTGSSKSSFLRVSTHLLEQSLGRTSYFKFSSNGEKGLYRCTYTYNLDTISNSSNFGLFFAERSSSAAVKEIRIKISIERQFHFAGINEAAYEESMDSEITLVRIPTPPEKHMPFSEIDGEDNCRILVLDKSEKPFVDIQNMREGDSFSFPAPAGHYRLKFVLFDNEVRDIRLKSEDFMVITFYSYNSKGLQGTTRSKYELKFSTISSKTNHTEEIPSYYGCITKVFRLFLGNR
jgi:hypothetical protein